MKRLIYADHAATTRLDDDAFDAMTPFLRNEFANPSQPYALARTAKKALKDAREVVANAIGAAPDEIFFTSGGTESDNWAVKGTLLASAQKKSVLVSRVEHHAVLRACDDLERLGYPVRYLPVNSQGIVETATLEEQIAQHPTALVSVMTANNEIGSVQPIDALADVAHAHGALFHTDAVQAVGHLPIDVDDLRVDLLSASAHKFNGPKGIGFLYIRRGTKLVPFVSGGGQEAGMRAGTENVAAVVGMAVALKKNLLTLNQSAVRLNELTQALLDGLSRHRIHFIRNGAERSVPGSLSLSFPGHDGEALLHRLDLMGICVSTGAACNHGKTRVSRVLRAIGLDDVASKGTIRISLGNSNSPEDVATIVNALAKILG